MYKGMQTNWSRESVLRASTIRTASTATLGLYADLMPSPDRPFGEQTTMFRELSELGETRGVRVFVLPPGYARHRQGFSFTNDGWVKTTVPLPDVVLRRSGTFLTSHLKEAEADLRFFRKSRHLHTLPRICGNKWIVLSLFQQNPQLRNHVPETAVADTPKQVQDLLHRMKDVYVKPLTGAQGVSVYRLTENPSNIRVRYERRKVSRQTERLTQTFNPETILVDKTYAPGPSFMSFWESIGLKKCLVQETIPLPTLPGARPFDFRWLVQYVEGPLIAARVARVGGPSAVTTNIHTGGMAINALDALKQARFEDPQKLITKLDDVAISVARSLSSRYGGYAEVGVDLACKRDGSVVVFEVNPTPGRRMLRSLGTSTRQLSLEWLIEYAIKANR